MTPGIEERFFGYGVHMSPRGNFGSIESENTSSSSVGASAASAAATPTCRPTRSSIIRSAIASSLSRPSASMTSARSLYSTCLTPAPPPPPVPREHNDEVRRDRQLRSWSALPPLPLPPLPPSPLPPQTATPEAPSQLMIVSSSLSSEVVSPVVSTAVVAAADRSVLGCRLTMSGGWCGGEGCCRSDNTDTDDGDGGESDG